MQTTVATWEAHEKSGAATNLITNGLIAVQKNGSKYSSPDMFEMNPAENRLSEYKTGNAISALCDCKLKSFRASA